MKKIAFLVMSAFPLFAHAGVDYILNGSIQADKSQEELSTNYTHDKGIEKTTARESFIRAGATYSDNHLNSEITTVVKQNAKGEVRPVIETANVTVPLNQFSISAGLMEIPVFKDSEKKYSSESKYYRNPYNLYGQVMFDNMYGGKINYKMDLGYMSKIEFAGYYGAAKNKLSMVEDYPQDYKAKNLAGGFVSFSVAKNLELWGSYFKTRLEYKDDTFNQSINDIDALNGMIPGTSAIADRYRIDQTYSEMGSLGMSYKGKGYWFDAEYALSDVKSGYAAIGLDMGSFRPYVMYSDMVTKKPTPDNVIPTGVSPLLDIASASADYLQSVAQTHQYGAAIGFKYNLNKNIDLKAQYEYVRVPEGRGLVYTANTDKAFNNIGAGVDFKF